MNEWLTRALAAMAVSLGCQAGRGPTFDSTTTSLDTGSSSSGSSGAETGETESGDSDGNVCDALLDEEVVKSAVWVFNSTGVPMYVEVAAPCARTFAEILGPDSDDPLPWQAPSCWTCGDAVAGDCDCSPPECWHNTLLYLDLGGSSGTSFFFGRYEAATVPFECDIASDCERECAQLFSAPPGEYEFRVRASTECDGECTCTLDPEEGSCYLTGALTGEVVEYSDFVQFPEEKYPTVVLE